MGNMHIVTGFKGQNHVTAADMGSFNAAIFGTGQYVLNRGSKFKTTVLTNNSIRVADGDLLIQGRHVRLNEGTYADLTVENGTQGYYRNDLIVARYTKNSDTGIEDVNLVVIKGTPASQNPVDPAYTSGDIIEDHVYLADMPLYRIPLNGLNVGTLVPLFTMAALSILDASITTAKIANGAVTTAKVADKNITSGKIADLAVGTAKVADKAITTAKIADLAVTEGKIANSAVTASKIASGAVSKVITGTLLASAWALESASGAYTQTVNNLGTDITSGQTVVDYSIGDGVSGATQIQISEAWTPVRISTGSSNGGNMFFRFKSQPTIDIPFKVLLIGR